MFFAVFEVLAAVVRRIPVFWDMPPCRVVYVLGTNRLEEFATCILMAVEFDLHRFRCVL